ncbi:integrase [Archaeoglobales archaeon]|nr:MAG: integrase [Archaeoglobales archaeon]
MLFDYRKKHERLLEKVLGSERISIKNKDLFLRFRRHLIAEGHSDAHIDKLLSALRILLENVDFDLEEAEKEDIEEIVAWINQREVSEETKRQYKIMIKLLYKWLNNGEYPDKVRWIKTTAKQRNNTLPKDILTEKDVKKLIEAAENPRDKAFIALLWETGARIGELYDLRVGDFQDHRHGLQIVITGKTGARRLPLIESVPYIRAWLNMHPGNTNREAPAWINLGTKNRGEKVGYRALYKMLKETAEKAGIRKPINPHHFRHSRATYLANRFTEAQLCEWFGWVQGSDIAARYVHLSGRDIDDAYAMLHGIKEAEEVKLSKLTPVKCPRCFESNAPDANFCYRCGQALNLDAAMKVEEAESKLMETFASLQDGDVMKMLKVITTLYQIAREDEDVKERLKILMSQD